MLNKLSTFLGLSAKRNKRIAYTKGYWVSDIMIYDLKGSLHGSVCLSDFAKEAYSNHHI